MERAIGYREVGFIIDDNDSGRTGSLRCAHLVAAWSMSGLYAADNICGNVTLVLNVQPPRFTSTAMPS